MKQGIAKHFSKLTALASTLMLLFSCSEDAFIVDAPSKELVATIPAYQYEDGTRVSISQNLQTYAWSDGDKIGLYADNSSTSGNAVFSIKQGGSSSGTFTNDFFSLKPNYTYYAFYPYSADATVDSYPVDFTGQIQTTNEGTEHIGAMNYLYAVVGTDANGGANIEFQNIASVLQVKFAAPADGTYKEITVTSSGNKFITMGTADMKTGSITATETSASMELSLGDGITLSEGDVLTANLLVAPVNLSGTNLTVTLTATDGTETTKKYAGKNLEAGKAHRLDTEIAVTTYLGHEYVDLGITDDDGNPVYFATTNLGADNAYDYGNYYAWGETKGYGEEDTTNAHNYAYNNSESYVKSYFDWSTYKYATGDTWTTLSKYSYQDGQTSGSWYTSDGEGNYTYVGLNGVENQTQLESSDDAATVNWGSGWRMPTYSEWSKLSSTCYWKWTDGYKSTGIAGYIVYVAKSDSDKGKKSTASTASYYVVTDSHIFLPAAGGRVGASLINADRYGHYWSSELLNSYSYCARRLYFSSDDVSAGRSNYRCFGYSVRPVYSPQTSGNEEDGNITAPGTSGGDWD